MAVLLVVGSAPCLHDDMAAAFKIYPDAHVMLVNGACVAVDLAFQKLITEGKIKETALKERVAAVSVGVVGGEVLLDLDYLEDRDATVDLNLVMTQNGEFVEVQGSGEEATFGEEALFEMLRVGRAGIESLLALQEGALTVSAS